MISTYFSMAGVSDYTTYYKFQSRLVVSINIKVTYSDRSINT